MIPLMRPVRIVQIIVWLVKIKVTNVLLVIHDWIGFSTKLVKLVNVKTDTMMLKLPLVYYVWRTAQYAKTKHSAWNAYQIWFFHHPKNVSVRQHNILTRNQAAVNLASNLVWNVNLQVFAYRALRIELYLRETLVNVSLDPKRRAICPAKIAHYYPSADMTIKLGNVNVYQDIREIPNQFVLD